MSRSIICRARTLWLGAALCVLAVAAEIARAEAPCSASPQAAAASYLGEAEKAHPGTAAGRISANTGYRVQRVVNDAAQSRTWLWIQSCQFPARPAQLTSVPRKHAVPPLEDVTRPSLDVHAGDDVLVLKTSDVALLRMMGRALQGGRRGQSVPVRLPGFQGSMVVSGRITEPGVVRLGD